MKDFHTVESQIIRFWRFINAFKKSESLSATDPEYVFYDGPPFATGLPHYGHILSGTLKDAVTRFYHAKGHRIERRFGWDCHGLPVEHEIDKKLKIVERTQIEEMGIGNYNAECRGIVDRYVEEWKSVVERMGRWIDMDNAYRTMDIEYMEKVWGVFKELYEKGLVYEGYRVMPCSTACGTPLSNFEANQNYREIEDPTVLIGFDVKIDFDNLREAESGVKNNLKTDIDSKIGVSFADVGGEKNNLKTVIDDKIGVSFSVVGGEKCLQQEKNENNFKKLSEFEGKFCGTFSDKNESIKLIAFTTTPWTLTSNLCLAINAAFTYTVFKHGDKLCCMATECLSRYFPGAIVVRTVPGSALVGISYTPLYTFFDEYASKGFFVVIHADFVTLDGTGVVHVAPGFGEDDYEAVVSNGLIKRNDIVPCPITDSGKFTDAVPPFAGLFFKDVDSLVLDNLNERGHLMHRGTAVHRYPFCWRSDTPLVYRLVPNWFIRVTDSIESLLKNNEEINWVPGFVKDKKFHNWLSAAKDWSISRNRYWGTPIPLWECNGKFICIGSVNELKESVKNGAQNETNFEINDIHREFIDGIKIKIGEDVYTRVDGVFDCWFESGSMPFCTKNNICADFIAEGIDQTRGWFYTLHVLSTLLNGRNCFKNVIVSGIVLAEDGKKMSKRLKNYPDPVFVMDKHGADSLRMYLLSSPVVVAENLCFSEKGVEEVKRNILMPWYNSLMFLLQALNFSETDNFNEWAKDDSPAVVPESHRFLNYWSGSCEQGVSEMQSESNFDEIDDEEITLKKTDQKYKMVMDDWIVNKVNILNHLINVDMSKYVVNSVYSHAVEFINFLSNWYIRMNRKYIYCQPSALKYVLERLCVIMAPFTPFFAEYAYQQLKLLNSRSFIKDDFHYPESVHFIRNTQNDCFMPVHPFDTIIPVIDGFRTMRQSKCLNLKRPIKAATIICEDSFGKTVKFYSQVIKRECNVLKINVEDEGIYAFKYTVKPFYEQLKNNNESEFKRKLKAISDAFNVEKSVKCCKNDVGADNINKDDVNKKDSIDLSDFKNVDGLKRKLEGVALNTENSEFSEKKSDSKGKLGGIKSKQSGSKGTKLNPIVFSSVEPIFKICEKIDIKRSELLITKECLKATSSDFFMSFNGFSVVFDLNYDEEIENLHIRREFYSFIQTQRKVCGLSPCDSIFIQADALIKEICDGLFIFSDEGEFLWKGLFSFNNTEYRVTIGVIKNKTE